MAATSAANSAPTSAAATADGDYRAAAAERAARCLQLLDRRQQAWQVLQRHQAAQSGLAAWRARLQSQEPTATLTKDQVSTELQQLASDLNSSDIETLLGSLAASGDGHYAVAELLQAVQLWLRPHAAPRSCLLIIDVQHDFIDGSLALKDCPAGEDGAAVVPVINKLRNTAGFNLVALSLDWHPADHISFRSQLTQEKIGNPPKKNKPLDQIKVYDEVTLSDGTKQVMWPDHCVQHSHGAKLVPELVVADSDLLVYKGVASDLDSYSAFWDNCKRASTGLADYLRKAQIQRVFLCGLAFDVCVRYSALDAVDEGFETFVVDSACAAVSKEGRADTIKKFAEKGVRFITAAEVPELVAKP